MHQLLSIAAMHAFPNSFSFLMTVLLMCNKPLGWILCKARSPAISHLYGHPGPRGGECPDESPSVNGCGAGWNADSAHWAGMACATAAVEEADKSDVAAGMQGGVSSAAICKGAGSAGLGCDDSTSSRASFKRPCLTGRVTMAYLQHHGSHIISSNGSTNAKCVQSKVKGYTDTKQHSQGAQLLCYLLS